MNFTALQDFFSPELQSQYCRDLTYTVRPGDDLLTSLVPKWAKDGKISIGDAPGSMVVGTDK